jgi:hypothetical protein
MTPAVELPVLAPSDPGAVPKISRERYEEVARKVRLLSWLSLGWMTIEGAVAITAGVSASSVALIGFGLDSVIEGIASLIIIWRFTGDRVLSHAAEERAQKLVAVQFFLLAPYVAVESVRVLIDGEHPSVSVLGIALSVGSIVFMPVLGTAKERLADQIGSAATKGEGRQNMLCAYLAGALFVGLLGNALFGAWWLDPAVGLLIAAVAVREGVDAWRGEGCCVGSPLDGAGFAEDCCEDGECRSSSGPDGPDAAVPIACSLSATGLRDRQDDLGRFGAAQLITRSSGVRGEELRFRRTPENEERLRSIVGAEEECCPFLDFELTADKDAVVLRIGAGPDARAVAAGLAGMFD